MKYLLILIVFGVALSGCVKDKPVPVVQEMKTFCWQVTLIVPYSYLYHNKCEKDEVYQGEMEGAKIMYKNSLQDSRREFLLKERKELY